MRQKFHHEILEEHEGEIDFAPKGKGGKKGFLRDLRALCGENIFRHVPVTINNNWQDFAPAVKTFNHSSTKSKRFLDRPTNPMTLYLIRLGRRWGEIGRQDMVLSMEENGKKCNIETSTGKTKEENTHEHA